MTWSAGSRFLLFSAFATHGHSLTGCRGCSWTSCSLQAAASLYPVCFNHQSTPRIAAPSIPSHPRSWACLPASPPAVFFCVDVTASHVYAKAVCTPHCTSHVVQKLKPLSSQQLQSSSKPSESQNSRGHSSPDTDLLSFKSRHYHFPHQYDLFAKHLGDFLLPVSD